MKKPKILSKTALAKQFGVDRGTVDRRIAHLEPVEKYRNEHLYDLAAVTKVFAKFRAKKAADQLLSNARRRRLTAQCEILRDKVTRYHTTLCDRADAIAARHVEFAFIKSEIMKIADRLPSDMAGMNPHTVFNIVDAEVRATLTALGNSSQEPTKAPDDSIASKPKDLAKLSDTKLTTLRHDLQATSLEFARAIRKGELLRLSDWEADTNDALLRARSRLLGIAGRLSSLVSQVSPEQLKRELHDLLCGALEELDQMSQPPPEDPNE